VGGEVRNPGRVIPRSIIYSVLAVAAIYALTNLGLIAVVPWREAVHSKFIAADFMEKLYGTRAASGVTVLVLWTALASVFALLFGYSRIPYAAALNGDFFKIFARLHPTGDFPHVSLMVMGGLSIVACLWTLDDVITALVTSRIIIQFIAQIFAQAPAGDGPAISNVAVPGAGGDRVCGLGIPVSDVWVEVRGVRCADISGRSWGILDLDPKLP
jgi:amino acid transporter